VRALRVGSDGALPVSTALRAGTDRLVFGLAVGAITLGGYAQGAIQVAVTLPAVLGAASVVVLQAAVACVTLSVMFGVSGLALLAKLRPAETASLPERGPTVTAVVPVYGDAAVLHRSVESLLASRYRDLQVVIVAEPDDDESIARAHALAADTDRVEVVINTTAPGSKAGAVNHAAAVTDSEYFAVFDADERVAPKFVSSAVARLDDGLDVVQGRTVPAPDGLVETVAYYESVVLGDLSRRLTSLLTDFTMAASRTVVMRRAAFETVGGYDPEMLTEDYDFAFACYTAGLAVGEQFAHASTIEAAHTLTDWWGQRKRWMTGYAQVLHRLLGRCRSPSGYRSLVAPAICAGSVFGNLFMLSLVPKAAVLLLEGTPRWLCLPVATLAVTALVVRLHDVTRGRLDDLGVGYLLLPAILPMYSLAGIKAVVEYLLTWDGEWYSVAKG
jgi:cellulose synthase/poly-beta-1,6-N-acetylglucosamine synthase-like glycosyltransferase